MKKIPIYLFLLLCSACLEKGTPALNKIGYADLETRWLYEYSPTIASREGCPRPNAAKNQLVEKEYWQCENHLDFPEITLKDKDLNYILRFIHRCPEGIYSREYFETHTPSPEYREAEASLSRFLDIHRQYFRNSNQPYVEWSETTFSPSEWPDIKKFKDYLIAQLKKAMDS